MFEYGVNATVLPWDKNYNKQELDELSDNIDYFVANPYGIALLIDRYEIKPEKCIAIAHAVRDLNDLKTFSSDNRKRLHGYGVVSNWLSTQSRELGIERVPTVVPNPVLFTVTVTVITQRPGNTRQSNKEGAKRRGGTVSSE